MQHLPVLEIFLKFFSSLIFCPPGSGFKGSFTGTWIRICTIMCADPKTLFLNLMKTMVSADYFDSPKEWV